MQIHELGHNLYNIMTSGIRKEKKDEGEEYGEDFENCVADYYKEGIDNKGK